MTNFKDVFAKFTNRYQLSKTLRFELKPVRRTTELLQKYQILAKDRTVEAAYRQSKFYFDELHRQFISVALSEINAKVLDFQTLALEYEKHSSLPKKDQYNDKIYFEVQKAFRQQVLNLLNEQADELAKRLIADGVVSAKAAGKHGGLKLLFSANIINELCRRYPKDRNQEYLERGWPSLLVKNEASGEEQYIFDVFKGFSTYFGRFQKNRENLYLANGEITSVITRIVSNFVVFLRNKKQFEDKIKRHVEDLGISDEQAMIFGLDYYSCCILQDGIDRYNVLLGQINQRIKELRDKRYGEIKGDERPGKADYPLFKKLDKQILATVEKETELITDDNDVMMRFSEFVEHTERRASSARELMHALFDGQFDDQLDQIYLRHTALNTISHVLLSEPLPFLNALPQRSKGKTEKDEPKVAYFVSLQDVISVLESVAVSTERIFKDRYYGDDSESGVIDAGSSISQQFFQVWRHEFDGEFSDRKINDRVVSGFDSVLLKAKEYIGFGVQFTRTEEAIGTIKNYADAVLGIHQRLAHLALEAKDESKLPTLFSAEFYDAFSSACSKFGDDVDTIRYYNAFRNYLTKKPSDDSKIKINFEKGNLLGGWQESPEGNAQYNGYVLKRDGHYYLGITTDPHFLDHVSDRSIVAEDGEDYFEKMTMCSLNWGKNIVGGQVYSSYRGVKYQVDKANLSPKQHVAVIKDLVIQKYLKRYPELRGWLDENFENVKEMQKAFDDLSVGGIGFLKIKADVVENQVRLVKEREKVLFLFEIINKDFRNNSNKKGVKNLHTLYFEAMLSSNGTPGRISILGGAEVFHRDAAVKERNMIETKKENRIIGRPEGDICHQRRYTEEKFSFHLPISINPSADKLSKFNQSLNDHLKNVGGSVNIIGVDRGEKHLAYYTVIDQQGNILDGGSLNEINGINYYQLLHEREKERLLNRQSWLPIRQIKDLKRGYVSALVKKLCDLAIEHNAIIVMEDLNMRFKQIRGGIEKSAYQQMEKALIDKLNYLTFKDRAEDAPGGISNGYQLTAPFESFEKMGKQTGILMYTQANYTSVTDPISGFRKNVYISNSAGVESIKKILRDEKLKLRWDDELSSYIFSYDVADFARTGKRGNKAVGEAISQIWELRADIPRIRRERKDGYWKAEKVNPNDLLKALLNVWDFSDPMGDITEQLHQKSQDELLKGSRLFDGKERTFFHAFIYIFNLILQLRNSSSKQYRTDAEGHVTEVGDDVDFIASPVAPYFSTPSKCSKANLCELDLKWRGKAEDGDKFFRQYNGDANGAYNIARKGTLMLERIRENSDKPDLFISNDNWDSYAAGSR